MKIFRKKLNPDGSFVGVLDADAGLSFPANAATNRHWIACQAMITAGTALLLDADEALPKDVEDTHDEVAY